MAYAKVMKGTRLLIKVGDGADPEVFAHPCLINSARGITFSAGTTEDYIPDCDDPDLLQAVIRTKNSYSAAINGAGVLHTPSVEEYFEWLKDPDTKNIQVLLNAVALADGGGHFAGAFHLTSFEISGDREGYSQCSIELQSSGALTWVDASS